MPEDFYTILGVERDADTESIKQAYRRQVKKCHPDASGTGNSATRFRAVEAAYETLRDSSRRAAYDRELERRGSAPRNSEGESGFSRTRPAAAGRGTLQSGWPYPGGLEPFAALAFASGASRAAGGLPFGPWRSAEPLLEVILSPEEAVQGTEVTVELPAVRTCPQCGYGSLWERLMCATCAGAGRIRSPLRVTLELPPRLRHGDEFRCDLGLSAGEGPGFRVRVLVEPW
jgi:molecular chaperone DnaJ